MKIAFGTASEPRASRVQPSFLAPPTSQRTRQTSRSHFSASIFSLNERILSFELSALRPLGAFEYPLSQRFQFARRQLPRTRRHEAALGRQENAALLGLLSNNRAHGAV